MPALSMSQVVRRMEQGQVAPLYLLGGEESYLMQQYLSRLVEGILEGAPRDFNYDVLEADGTSVLEAIHLASILPMMAPYRVVVLQGIQQLRKAEIAPLEAYAAAPHASTAVICTLEADLGKCSAALRNQSVAIACKRLEGDRLAEWVEQRVADRHYRVSRDAVRTLLQEQDHDLRTIASEIEKLCTYVGERTDITVEDVQAVGQASRQQSIFSLSDAIGSREIPRALTVLHHLLYQGEPPLVIFSLMVRHLRLLWSIQQLVQKRTNVAGIAKAVGVPQGVCRQLATQSQQFSTDRLRQLYQAALEADRTFKSSNKPPQAVLEGLIFALCAV